MRAVRFHRNGGAEVLGLEELPVPEAQAGELLVRVEASGVNYADIVRRRGDHYPVPTPLPFIAGGEIVGIVEKVGDDVPAEWIGRRVLAAPFSGGYAEYTAVGLAQTFPCPDGIDPVTGCALLIQGLSAALILNEAAALKPGDSVFIEGAAGGVGCLAVQLARIYGAGIVIGAASTAEKRSKVIALGADAAVDYMTPDWARALLEATSERGVDVALEMTGGDVFRDVFSSLAPGGRIVVYGIASHKPYAIPSEYLIARAQTVTGFYLGRFFPKRELITATLSDLAALVREGRLAVEIGGTFPLERAADAHRLLEGRQTSGKLVLVPGM